jgi:hypothetical protein
LVVRKKAGCKAKHISLAVIRPLSALMPGLLEDLCSAPTAGVYLNERRKDAEDFLHRVLNQNEQANGWVYLHPDADVGIGDPAVAMLRISISLRASDHYELIKQARCGRLDTEYRNKLGWLKGNLYSRIDTTDWSEREVGDSEEKRIINDLLETPIGDRRPLWVPDAWIAEARRKKVNFDQLPSDQLDSVLKAHAPKPSLDAALDEVKKAVNQVRQDFTDVPAASFDAQLRSDSCIMHLVGMSLAQSLSAFVGREPWHFCELLASDQQLASHFADAMKENAVRFATRHGPRTLTHFVDVLKETKFLNQAAIERIVELGASAFGNGWSTNHQQVPQLLEEMTLPPALVEHLRLAAVTAIQESVAERCCAKLINNQPFKKTLRLD